MHEMGKIRHSGHTTQSEEEDEGDEELQAGRRCALDPSRKRRRQSGGDDETNADEAVAWRFGREDMSRLEFDKLPFPFDSSGEFFFEFRYTCLTEFYLLSVYWCLCVAMVSSADSI